MSLGMRVQQLIDGRGHSLREAEEVTGVSRETIRRIIKGYCGPTADFYAKRIAKGYGVPERALLEGMDPKGDFEFTITQAPSAQRLEFLLMSRQERVRLAIDFLQAKYREVCSIDLLAAASGMSSDELRDVLSRWELRVPDLATSTALALGISRVTGISSTWFTHGWVSSEHVSSVFTGHICRLCTTTIRDGRRHPPRKVQEVLRLVARVVG